MRTPITWDDVLVDAPLLDAATLEQRDAWIARAEEAVDERSFGGPDFQVNKEARVLYAAHWATLALAKAPYIAGPVTGERAGSRGVTYATPLRQGPHWQTIFGQRFDELVQTWGKGAFAV